MQGSRVQISAWAIVFALLFFDERRDQYYYLQLLNSQFYNFCALALILEVRTVKPRSFRPVAQLIEYNTL